MKSFLGIAMPRRVNRGEDVKSDDHNSIVTILVKLIEEIRAVTLNTSNDIGFNRNSGGTTLWIKKRTGGGSSAAPAGPCYFGEIISYTEETEDSDSSGTPKTGIRGGYLEAGDKIWNVPNREIDLGASGVFLVWIRVAITANTDSTHVATLSGLETSEEPTWENGDGSDDYEDKVIPNPFPTSAPGDGVAIVPIGILTIADGAATLARTGCGNIIIDHCPGTLSHHRGPVVVGSDSAPP
ncbi:MAG: hypothetical protein V4819_19155 [Verrucomicrobiota bacterium]